VRDLLVGEVTDRRHDLIVAGAIDGDRTRYALHYGSQQPARIPGKVVGLDQWRVHGSIPLAVGLVAARAVGLIQHWPSLGVGATLRPYQLSVSSQWRLQAQGAWLGCLRGAPRRNTGDTHNARDSTQAERIVLARHENLSPKKIIALACVDAESARSASVYMVEAPPCLTVVQW